MASVSLSFSAPFHPDLTTLKIYEAAVAEGPFTLIEEVTDIGEYPDYIDNWTTEFATSDENWFSIQWFDEKGAASSMSNPWKGGTDSIVNQIADRVMQRESNTTREVVVQEAEAVAETYYGIDPYTVPLPVSYRTISGLTYLTLANVMAGQIIFAGGGSFTAGLVSMKSDTSFDLDKIVRMGMKYLGLDSSVIAQMKPVAIAGGMSEIVEFDLSRLLIDVA